MVSSDHRQVLDACCGTSDIKPANDRGLDRLCCGRYGQTLAVVRSSRRSPLTVTRSVPQQRNSPELRASLAWEQAHTARVAAHAVFTGPISRPYLCACRAAFLPNNSPLRMQHPALTTADSPFSRSDHSNQQTQTHSTMLDRHRHTQSHSPRILLLLAVCLSLSVPHQLQ